MAKKTSNKSGNRSDITAKEAFRELLADNGFELPKWDGDKPCPSDIYASYQQKEYFFEIKKTKIKEKKQNIFGAASLNEWKAAMDNSGRYFFVLTVEQDNGTFDFYLIKPETFMAYSAVPSFKIYFNIPVEKIDDGLRFFKPGREKETLIMDSSVFKKLNCYWKKLQNNNRNEGQKKQEGSNDFLKVNKNGDFGEQLKVLCEKKHID